MNNTYQEFTEAVTYITRTDNPYVLYEYYSNNHTPLELFKNIGVLKTAILGKSCSESISSEQLLQIINELIELQESGIEVSSRRIPLLEEKYKFKGYRRVEFSYQTGNKLKIITITHKKKEIYLTVAEGE